MNKLRAVLNWLPHWAFVGLSIALGTAGQAVYDALLNGPLTKAAFLGDLRTGLAVGVAALIGYLKTDPWSSPPTKSAKIPPGAVSMFLMLFGGGLAGLSFISTGLAGCQQLQAAAPELNQIERIILLDVQAGKSSEQILEDVGKQVAGKPGVDAVIVAFDVLTALVDAGVIDPKFLPKAKEHQEHFKAVLGARK